MVKEKQEGGVFYPPPPDKIGLTLFDMGFFEPSVMGAMNPPSNHNFVVIAPMIVKFGAGIKLDLF